MAFYEVVGRDGNNPAHHSAENLKDAKNMLNALFATGKYELVFIRQYIRDRFSDVDRYRVLHRFTQRKP